MSANKTKKVKMATKSCPDCDQQVSINVIGKIMHYLSLDIGLADDVECVWNRVGLHHNMLQIHY